VQQLDVSTQNRRERLEASAFEATIAAEWPRS
jgi:hypothetical protein